MKTDEIKGVLREYKKTDELWMNPNDIVECLNDILASRERVGELEAKNEALGEIAYNKDQYCITLEKRVKELEDILQKRGVHGENCKARDYEEEESCNCGLNPR